MAIQGFGMTVCHDSGDNSSDLIVTLPPEVIEALQVQPGDELKLEIVDGLLVITPSRNALSDA